MISSDLLTKVLIAAGIPAEAICIFDEDYELLTPESITVTLSAQMRDFLFAHSIKWTESLFDCNKFSKLASTLADVDWINTRPAGEAALAFGLFAYSGHMINVAVHLKLNEADPSRQITAEDLRVAFYEPQPQVPDGRRYFTAIPLAPVTLKPEEIKTCLMCEFI